MCLGVINPYYSDLRFGSGAAWALQLTQLCICVFVSLLFKFAAESMARLRVCRVVCAFVGLCLQLTQLRGCVLHATILNNTC